MGDVPDVVDHKRRNGEETHGNGSQPRLEVHGIREHIGGSRRSDETEEDEDENLSETQVAIGALAARVEVGGDYRGSSGRKKPPVLAANHNDEPRNSSDAKPDKGDSDDRARSSGTRSR